MRPGLLMTLLLLGCADGDAPVPFDLHVEVDAAADALVPADDGGPADGMVLPICGSAACTGDNLCQEPTGQVSQCSLPPDAGVRPGGDGGASCVTAPCVKGAAGDLLCQIACAKTSASCVAITGSGTHCTP